MKLRCASCKQVLKAPDDAAGKVVSCPACGKKIRVPAAAPTTAAAPVPPTPQPTEPPPPAFSGAGPSNPAMVPSPGDVPSSLDPFADAKGEPPDDEVLIMDGSSTSKQNRILLMVSLLVLVLALGALGLYLKYGRGEPKKAAKPGEGPTRLVGAIGASMLEHAESRTVYLIPRSVELRDIHRRFCSLNEEVRPYWQALLDDNPLNLAIGPRARAMNAAPKLKDLYKELRTFLHDANGRRVMTREIDNEGRFDFGEVPEGVYYIVYHLRHEPEDDPEDGTRRETRNYVWMLQVFIRNDRQNVIAYLRTIPKTVVDKDGKEHQMPGEAFIWFDDPNS